MQLAAWTIQCWRHDSLNRCTVVTRSCAVAFSTFDVSALALRDIGLRDATDREIFLAARRQGATVMTKDGDFVRLLEDLGPPPQVIWITCGNTSNGYLKQILSKHLPGQLEFLRLGEVLIELS
jgi:predicted nuclease of predicted toxin-antitoxin system